MTEAGPPHVISFTGIYTELGTWQMQVLPFGNSWVLNFKTFNPQVGESIHVGRGYRGPPVPC